MLRSHALLITYYATINTRSRRGDYGHQRWRPPLRSCGDRAGPMWVSWRRTGPLRARCGRCLHRWLAVACYHSAPSTNFPTTSTTKTDGPFIVCLPRFALYQVIITADGAVLWYIVKSFGASFLRKTQLACLLAEVISRPFSIYAVNWKSGIYHLLCFTSCQKDELSARPCNLT